MRLLRRHWADLLAKQDVCVRSIRIEMHGVSVVLSFSEQWITGIIQSFHHLCGSAFRCVVESPVPFLFVTRSEECPVSSRESLRVILDFSKFEINCSEFPLFVFSMSLNSNIKMIRSSKS